MKCHPPRVQKKKKKKIKGHHSNAHVGPDITTTGLALLCHLLINIPHHHKERCAE